MKRFILSLFILFIFTSYVKPYQEGYKCTYRKNNVIIWTNVNIDQTIPERKMNKRDSAYAYLLNTKYTFWERVQKCQ